MLGLHIPDAHDKEDVPKDRFEWLGRLIVDRQPDVVVESGDFSDIPSLCKYEWGKQSHQGSNIDDDVESARLARSILTAPIRALQEKQRTDKKKVWQPRLIALGGNHEHRMDKYRNDNPVLGSRKNSILGKVFNQDVSGAAEQGWEWHEFGQIVTVQDIDFCHYFVSGSMGRPIGGIDPARTLVSKRHRSSVQGHDHRLSWHMEKLKGKEIHGLVGGCYFDHYEPYAGQANDMWWAGVTLMHNMADGRFEPEFISLAAIRHDYGGIL